MGAVMHRTDRVIGVVESVELLDSVYGITKEEREVLDALHSYSETDADENEVYEWVYE